jgi:hypothetical protein
MCTTYTFALHYANFYINPWPSLWPCSYVIVVFTDPPDILTFSTKPRYWPQASGIIHNSRRLVPAPLLTRSGSSNGWNSSVSKGLMSMPARVSFLSFYWLKTERDSFLTSVIWNWSVCFSDKLLVVFYYEYIAMDCLLLQRSYVFDARWQWRSMARS